MTGHQDPRQVHRFSDMCEGAHVNGDGWNAGLFDQPGEVSHGHMAERSSGDEEDGIEVALLEPLHPLRPGLREQPLLRGCSDE